MAGYTAMNISDNGGAFAGGGRPQDSEKEWKKKVDEYLNSHKGGGVNKEQIEKLLEEYLATYKPTVDTESITKEVSQAVNKSVTTTVTNYMQSYSTTVEQYLTDYGKTIEKYITENTALNSDTLKKIQSTLTSVQKDVSNLKKDVSNLKKNSGTSTGVTKEQLDEVYAKIEELREQSITNYQNLVDQEQNTGKVWLDENNVWNRVVLPATISFNDKRWTYVQNIPDFDKIQTIISIKGIITAYGKVQNAVHNVDIWRVTAEGGLEVRSLFGESTLSAIYMEYTKRES